MKPAVFRPAARSRSRCSMGRRTRAWVPVRNTRPESSVYLSSSVTSWNLAGAFIGDLLADEPIAAECEAACFLTAIRGDLNRALRCCRVVAELQFCADEKP